VYEPFSQEEQKDISAQTLYYISIFVPYCIVSFLSVIAVTKSVPQSLSKQKLNIHISFSLLEFFVVI